MLTNEDRMIFRARMGVAAQAALHRADRCDAHAMWLASKGLRCPCGSIRSAVTWDCVLGDYCPVGH